MTHVLRDPDEVADYYGFTTFDEWAKAVQKYGDDICFTRLLSQDGPMRLEITGIAWTEGEFDPEFSEVITFPTTGEHIDTLRQGIADAIADWHKENEEETA